LDGSSFEHKEETRCGQDKTFLEEILPQGLCPIHAIVAGGSIIKRRITMEKERARGGEGE
jgi:hypothetical protein